MVLARGDVVLAREMLDEAHRMLDDPGTSEWGRWRYSMHLFASFGDTALAAGDIDGARRFADACLERAVRSRSRKYANRGWRLRADTAAARRDRESAEQALREALRLAHSMGSPAALWRTQAALGHLYVARGQPDAARAAYAASRDVVQRLVGTVRDSRLRAGLDGDPTIRRVIELGGPG